VSSTDRRNSRKELRNERFSVLPTFAPLNNYETYFINKSTDINLLHHLIGLVKNTTYFSVDTEGDKYTNKRSLIQFELIHEHLSTVILIEVCHIPKQPNSLVLWLIRSIFQSIFQSTKIIYSWGDPIEELSKFVTYRLFTNSALYQPTMIDLQYEFKEWHKGKHYGFNALGNDKWSLQYAVVNTYGQFLNKYETLNIWSRGLYRRNDEEYNEKLLSMIQYAIDDCLAVTKLAYTMGQDIGCT
jgi:hypothetical protein